VCQEPAYASSRSVAPGLKCLINCLAVLARLSLDVSADISLENITAHAKVATTFRVKVLLLEVMAVRAVGGCRQARRLAFDVKCFSFVALSELRCIRAKMPRAKEPGTCLRQLQKRILALSLISGRSASPLAVKRVTGRQQPRSETRAC
jgi:hypothetical protein